MMKDQMSSVHEACRSLQLKTRAITMSRYISSEQEIQEAALRLLRAELPIEVRLMGLRMSTFYQALPAEPGQQSLQTFLKASSPGIPPPFPLTPTFHFAASSSV